MAPIIRFKPLGLDYVEAFTAAHQAGKTPYERETLCQRVQFPAALVSPRESDFLAGKRTYPEVGYSVQYGGMGFYADFPRWPTHDNPMGYSASELSRWQALRSYWEREDATRQCVAGYAPAYATALEGVFTGVGNYDLAIYPLYRMAGLQLDLRKLVSLGVPGLEKDLETRRRRASDDEAKAFFSACLESVGQFREVIRHYSEEAGELPPSARRDAMIAALDRIETARPETFHEALQLVFLSSTVTGTINFGRLDIVLGDYLCADLDSGRITESHAMELMANFYTLIEEEIMHWDGRIIVGGKGRENERPADRFAMLAMAVTDSLNLPMPQLSLRFYDGQDPALLDKAYDVVAHGKTYPMLYNDDVNIPAVMKAFGVDEATAEQYIPYGCGEYMIHHQSCHTPNGIINLAKALEAALNNGRSLTTGKLMAPDFGNLCDYSSFEELWNAYDKTVAFCGRALAHAQSATYDIMGRTAPFSFVSMLYDDCLEKGRPLFAGGIRILGGTCETYGNTNCADSLTAIRRWIYDTGKWSRAELLQALRDNWRGFPLLRRDCKEAPKYGNDDDEADGMLLRVHDHVCGRVREAAEGTALDHFLVVVINNKINTVWGKMTSASADGRTTGEALAPGNAPGGGCDRSGLTAVLNSQAKPDPTIHAGAVQNVKVTSSFPVQHPDIYRAVFNSYFKRGGAQIMITVTNREDLLAARITPEKYANLIVRVGGFSARFIDLDHDTQEEILSRTEHGH
ncbi:MAG: pyruvate formate lyase family protein [Lentisphaeria bacterium]|nr:pyruvate formate lyase family protein [Lentisphaeria bacterium]